MALVVDDIKAVLLRYEKETRSGASKKEDNQEDEDQGNWMKKMLRSSFAETVDRVGGQQAGGVNSQIKKILTAHITLYMVGRAPVQCI